MTTDFRALCAELTEFVARLTKHYYQSAELLTRARAALANEPVAVTGQPSDEELLATLDHATASFPPRHPDAEALNAVEYPLALELRKARAVLARWGNPAPQPPADGEVAELVAWLLDEATQAADANQSIAAGMLTWAAQIVGEYAELESGND